MTDNQQPGTSVAIQPVLDAEEVVEGGVEAMTSVRLD